ncbi:NADH:flavin oxidoreductase [Paracoccus sp. SCSIO 75233]|uniref:NADH:flavin oxidoreductase n=1 Tax=Paracoccus sp. SCSIO 75233 TaxID=3017782 RepID=UPI0022EFEBED|nr:NADH:flavin oxidoreductase [Paracoccus sp. SCSIO 75233]WBU53032.1 NADH:flavin oxidoreductase [Paracoccus sp. SCSIO 75233]
MSSDPLFQPLQLKHLRIRNRMLSTAHEPAYTEDGMPKERYRLYHSEKARGGIGMTMIGGSAVVSPDSPPSFGNIVLYRDEVVRWMSELADDVHEHGAAVMIQITHLGRRNNWDRADWLPVIAPSHTREATHRAYAKAMEDWDIRRVISDYADAAERVKAAGLDGLEVQCYGHLIDQFWSPATNFREDEYGGSLDNRLRFGIEVCQAIRDRVGPDFLVGARLTCDEDFKRGFGPEEGLDIAKKMSATGLLDFLNVIRGHTDTHEGVSKLIPNMGSPSAPHLDFSGNIRAETGMPVFHAARIQDVATARHAIESGKLDMVGMTRAHIADPHIMAKISRGEEDRIRPCVGMGYCIDSIYAGVASCIHNAATGREATIPHVLEKAPQRRKVVVVGAGPGGLEAARIAGERGHEVVVFEAAPRAGGQILLAAALKRRREIIGIVDWRLAECEKFGVRFMYDHYAEAEDVLAENPDLVIIATGGMPDSGFLDAGSELATSSWDILSGAEKAARDVILFDDQGTHASMTTAEALLNQGAAIEIVTPERSLATEIGGTSYPAYFRAFGQAGVKFALNLRLERIEKSGNRLTAAFFDEYSKEYVTKETEQVVIENGVMPFDDLYFSLKPSSQNLGEIGQEALLDHRAQDIGENPDGSFRLFRIGDAVASRNIHAAIYEAMRLVKDF